MDSLPILPALRTELIGMARALNDAASHAERTAAILAELLAPHQDVDPTTINLQLATIGAQIAEIRRQIASLAALAGELPV